MAARPKATDSQLATQTSRQNSPAADSIGGSRKQPSVGGSTSAYVNARLLEESFRLSMRYGDEYMDENPITGHPGAFNLTSTGRKAKDNLAGPTQKTASLQNATKGGTSLVDDKATDAPPTRKGSKSDKTPKTPGIPKPKRKKSKVLNAGGVTPI